jgi:hypothetical protein
MANFDYDTGAGKPDMPGGSYGLGLLLIVAIAIALLALFSFFGGGTPPIAPGETGAGAGPPAADVPVTAEPVAVQPTPVQPAAD